MGAIRVARPTHRMVDKIERVNEELAHVCLLISHRLGYVGWLINHPHLAW
ncbi:TPA: hypothetical protein ACKRTE_000347 [Providencia rettgeri]